MSKRMHGVLALTLAAGAGIGLAVSGWGQTGERPLQKLFGSGAARSTPTPAKAAPDIARRRAEIDVELAWLSDPITFPYFLEARIDGGTLSVRGYVPDKAVRDHALKLARVYTTYAIADHIKEHPSLRVRLAKENPTQLQAAVMSTLREALPRQYQRLQVQCGADGTVTLRGPIASAEDKLIASHALRRLYGCSNVQNLMQIPGEPDVATARTLPPVKNKDPLAALGPLVPKKVSAPAVQGPSLLPPKELAAKEPAAKEPAAKEPAAKESAAKEPAPAAKKIETVKESPGSGAKLALSAEKVERLKKRVLEVCAGAKDLKIEITPANKLRIEMTVRSDEEITTFAGKVYGMSELTDYRDAVELYFTVGQGK